LHAELRAIGSEATRHHEIHRGRDRATISFLLNITVSFALTLLAASTMRVHASEVDLPALAGHPRSRFPLPTYVSPISDRKLDGVVQRAIADWNLLFRESFGVDAFSRNAENDQATIRVAIRPSTSEGKLMGETELEVDDDGVIRLPVKITLSPPKPRGKTLPTSCFTRSRRTSSAMLSASRTVQIHSRSCAACEEAWTSLTRLPEHPTSTPGSIRAFAR